MSGRHCVQSDSEILVIREATKLIGSKSSPRMAIDRILRLLSELLGLNRGRVLLPDDGGQLRIHYAYGLTDKEKERGVYSVGEGVTGRVMRTSRVGLVQDIDNEPLYLQRAVTRQTLPSETVAYIAVPILLDEEIVGVLGVHRLRHRERGFESDINILEIVASLIAQILRLHGCISESTAALAVATPVGPRQHEQPGAEHGLVGNSRALQKALRKAQQVANTRASVTLLGESGTGKELFARMLHAESERHQGPFVAINCAAIPSELMESELFGHEKGAFSGAVGTKTGKLEAAHGGTLFLDELAELDWDMQSKLLRALEERVIQRIGGNRDIAIDIRVVAATNAQLAGLVSQGAFRGDLYYRLNVFPIQLPALRERHEDIPALADYFLRTANEEFNRDVAMGIGVADRLAKVDWPGNVRQLANVMHRAVIMADTGLIECALIDAILAEDDPILEDGSGLPSRRYELPPQAAATDPAAMTTEGRRDGSPSLGDQPDGGDSRPYWRVDSHDVATLKDAIAQCHGNKTCAARRLGLTPRQLRYRLAKLDVHA